MSSSAILTVFIVYIVVLLLVSFITGRKSSGNAAFFIGNRQSPWLVVAFGMIGASLSGVSFVSVPGMPLSGLGFSYMQMVLGFLAGYAVIALVLLPLYYRLSLTTIYAYLQQRFGKHAYRTGAAFFLLSRTIGSAAKLYVVAILLQRFVFARYGIPFAVSVSGILLLIWLYTFRGGIKTIVWTDTLQTFCLLLAVVLMIAEVINRLDISFSETFILLSESELTRVFVFDDWITTQNFFKQFVNGMFITIVMTGLDQDMMQKNLSCRSLRESQKNMFSYGFAFIPTNLLFLSLGALLVIFAQRNGIALPAKPDELLPYFALNYLGHGVALLFVVGLLASSFANADSALTSLTTSFTVDMLGLNETDSRNSKIIRHLSHAGFTVLLVLCVLLINLMGGNSSLIDLIYRIASYTYGPLLGLFAFGLFTRRQTQDACVPFVCLLAPMLIALLDYVSKSYLSYAFGYELLMINAAIVFAGLWMLKK